MLMFLRFHQLLDVNELYQLKKPHLCNNSPVSFIRCSLCKEYLILFHWNLSHEPIAHTTGMSGTTSRGGGGYYLIWPTRGCAAGQGMVLSTKTERVVLNRVCILGIFRPKQGQGFKPSAVHLYPNIGGLKPQPPPPPHPPPRAPRESTLSRLVLTIMFVRVAPPSFQKSLNSPATKLCKQTMTGTRNRASPRLSSSHGHFRHAYSKAISDLALVPCWLVSISTSISILSFRSDL